MSDFTTQVRFICENAAGLDISTGFSDINTVIQKAIPKIFDFEFPVWDPAYRNVLCTKILRHYYTREIGEETVGLWKLRLETRLNEVMPYFNKLYETETLSFDPLMDADYSTTHSGTNNENGSVLGITNVTTQNTKDTAGSSIGSSTSKNEDASNSQENMTGGSTGTDITDEHKHDLSNNHVISAANASDTVHRDTDTTDWDKFSETPQGGLNGVQFDNYLTNARLKDIQERVTDTKQGHSDSDVSTTFEDTLATTGTVTHSENKDHNINVNSSSNSSGEETFTKEDSNTVKENGHTSTDTNNTTNISTTEDYTTRVTGKYPGTSYSKLILEFRETLLNIDNMVIDSLSDLFINLWGDIL